MVKIRAKIKKTLNLLKTCFSHHPTQSRALVGSGNHLSVCHISTRDWLTLPSDITLNILQRVGVADILQNVQKVCTAWNEICKDPAMWRIVLMDTFSGKYYWLEYCDMFQQAVDRSQGQMVDLTVGPCSNSLLRYIADRSSQLRRLELVLSIRASHWSEALEKLPLLEELSLVVTQIRKNDIEDVARYCPLLKTLKVHHQAYRPWRWRGKLADDRFVRYHNELALAIGKNFPTLTHLEVIGNYMTNVGLQAILDGCCLLELLDLRRCLYVDLKGDLGKRCSQIKYLKLPRDSLYGVHYNLFGLSDDY
ncbi:putative F-box/LRR-repeat protein 9 [Bidens hawaiensis]|uniref:putative F-box/LRR-repeat protein 9 n=1 Tax=Bidens hawaiensis TaxID=980011 RepID=UPI004048F90C